MNLIKKKYIWIKLSILKTNSIDYNWVIVKNTTSKKKKLQLHNIISKYKKNCFI